MGYEPAPYGVHFYITYDKFDIGWFFALGLNYFNHGCTFEEFQRLKSPSIAQNTLKVVKDYLW